MVTATSSSGTWCTYDVQLMGGIQLHLGKIAEMATGEGKTLVATLPLYLNALPGKGAHLVTVNSYLARRDSQWMGHVYTYLGLTVGCLDDTEPGTLERTRRVRVATSRTARTTSSASTTCATTWSSSLDQRVQRGHIFAIVDEVDSVLIDEARTPLIISGPVGNETRRAVRRAQRGGRRGSCGEQTELVNALVAEGERALEAGDTERRGAQALQGAARPPEEQAADEGCCRSRASSSSCRRWSSSTSPTASCRRRKQQFRDIEEDLLFVLDEKGHTVHLTDRGVEFMSPTDHDAFVLPDISSEAVHRIDHDHDADAARRRSPRDAIWRSSTRRRASGSTSCTSCCARTRCTRRT